MPGATSGWPDRAEQNGRIGFQFLEHRLGQNFAGLQIPLAAQVEILGFELDVFQLADGLQDFQAFRRHFRPRPVAADHRHAQFLIRCSLSNPVYGIGEM